MKTLQNKSLTLKGANGAAETYASLSKLVLNHVDRNSGVNYQEMGRRIKLIEAFDRVTEEDGSIAIEDADAADLKRLVAAFPWAIVDKDIFDYCAAVAAL